MFFLLALILSVQAEVIVDGSLGGGIQHLSGPNYNIHEGLGQRQGANLFHSFSQFNINTGEQANFEANGFTRNILARVTGGNLSLIDGLITSSNTANLWLMNPAGWVIGANAKLNLQGGFHLSSAHGIGFSGGEMFFADPIGQSVLTTAEPIDYQFKSGTQAKITLDQADLVMPENKDFSLVGGDISMKNATIRAPGGKILLASNSGQGEWRFDAAGLTQVSGSGGIIDIEHNTRAAEHAPSLTNSDFNSEVSAGTLQISAKKINLTNSSIVTHAWDNSHGGNTTLQAEKINLNASFIDNNVQGSKNAGNVIITGGDLRMDNGSIIKSDTNEFTTGQGGNINVDLKGQLNMSELSGISSNAQGNSSGDIQLNSDRIALIDKSSVRAIAAADSNAGNLNIVTNQLTINNKATLSTATLFGKGQGGNISIQASDIALARGGDITSTSGENAEGDAGKIEINARNLSLTDESTIRAESKGTGATGIINLDLSGIVKLEQNSKINTLAAQTNGGNINIVSQGLAVRQSQIVTSAEGMQGNGGDISINIDTFILSSGFIQANTNAVGASGGAILVNASNTIASQQGILVGSDQRQIFSPTSNLNVIQAAAPDGVGGPVNLSTVELNIAGQLAKIDSTFASQTIIANDPCNVARNEKMSSLIKTGQGGLPVKASDSINLPLHRHLPKSLLQPQSHLESNTQQLTLLTAQDVCKKDSH